MAAGLSPGKTFIGGTAMLRTEVKQARADLTYSAHDGNLWVLPITAAGMTYCRAAMPGGVQRMGMFYLVGQADAEAVVCGLVSAGLTIEKRGV